MYISEHSKKPAVHDESEICPMLSQWACQSSRQPSYIPEGGRELFDVVEVDVSDVEKVRRRSERAKKPAAHEALGVWPM